jgi:Chitobiase/beta-hexosaminidase C-terminal domain
MRSLTALILLVGSVATLPACGSDTAGRERSREGVDLPGPDDACCDPVLADPADESARASDDGGEAAWDAGVSDEGGAASGEPCARATCDTSSSAPAASEGDAAARPHADDTDAQASPELIPTSDAAGTGGSLSDAGAGASDAGSDAGGCWQLPAVDRVRLYPAPGKAALLAQGKIEGSNTSAMNGFVELARVASAPQEGQWIELRVAAARAYRYVKYHGPAASFGALAELELYAGSERLSGLGFGTAGARAGADSGFARALDGNTQSYFEGPLADDQYVGLDLASGHALSAPVFSASAATSTSQSVQITGPLGAQIRYSTDGSDPSSAGKVYAGPITLAEGSTLVRAVASQACMQTSEIAQSLYRVGAAGRAAQSSMHVGNSLTDTVVPYLQSVAQSGGITLDFNRYTVPGAGTWEYVEMPSGGFGVANIQEALRTRAFDHLSLQAYPNMPCQITASADGADSDSGYMNQMWSDARTQNPNVQLWVYHQWPEPVQYSNCLSGGGWTRGGWSPPAPKSWEEAVANELHYHEAVRAELVRLNPSAPTPYIIPAGNALVLLKQQIEAGAVPGLSSFFAQIFLNDGTDIHLTPIGAYYVTLVFYGCMFQKTPEGTAPDAAIGVSAAQAPVLQRLAWQAVTAYPLSGVTR